MSGYWCEHALLPDGSVADGVAVDIEAGRFLSVLPGSAMTGREVLAGLTVPGFANGHSHAFHRALRARAQGNGGSFWTWRDQMYEVADRLTPDLLFDLARATYREMAAAGYTSVGEFHYLHHTPSGASYDDANVMGEVLTRAAREAGIRITLLDTCYLASGIGRDVEGVQRRFTDGSVDAWAARVAELDQRMTSLGDDGVVVGAAIHSIRAVPRDSMPTIAEWATRRKRPLHAHLSEQVAENEACRQAYGRSPTQVLDEAGALGPQTTVVHATHLDADDIERLAGSRTAACFCPTTERDLGDGIGPARRLANGGAPLTLGSDSQAVIDPFEEMRGIELDERLAARRRGQFSPAELVTIGTANGHVSLGFPDVGRIEPGARADLVTLDLDSPRTAGGLATAENAVFAATSADVVQVICDGVAISTRESRRQVADALTAAVAACWGES